ncbi:hypothetical protein L2U69_10820 [Zavarzinia compransoris]|uniref:hypothetical protein n=1 Tax=Zavarzinia marina TaxID=2911065 RepID=UPI001F33A814|nr:hypothetical protein [Zavarzinia marina]MCF4166136.1 hypothetical protein [Zavarzinia marina]
MAKSDDTSRLFRAMGLEGEQGKYKDIGALSRRRSDGAEDLPLVAAVDDLLKAPATPRKAGTPEKSVGPENSVRPRHVPARAAPDTRHVPGAAPRQENPRSESHAQAPPASGTGLGRIFQRQTVASAERPPPRGTPLRTLFDRLR